MKRITTGILLTLCVLLVPATARAQATHDCSLTVDAQGIVSLICKRKAPVRPTSTPRATSTPTSTRTPTPTTLPPATTPAPLTGARVNVPIYEVAAGDRQLDANNWSIIWLGTMSPEGGYTQARMVGRTDGMMLYIQAMYPRATGAVDLSINGYDYQATYATSTDWDFGARCEDGSCRGWTASRFFPWKELGGKPAHGEEWPLSISTFGYSWDGFVHWGLPAYGGAQGAINVTLPLAADASLGGGTDCAHDDDPLNGNSAGFFADWGRLSRGAWGNGVINLGDISYANVQSQWDVADWPCYARYIAKWGLPQLPVGATLTGAWLDVYYFGASGYWAGDSARTMVQAYEVSPAWDEHTVTWDSAPAAGENISWTVIDECAEGVNCYGTRAIDITEIIRRAYAGGASEAATLLYTAAGQYHSGKYIYTREGGSKPVVRISYNPAGVASSDTLSPTASPAATSTLARTSTPAQPTPVPATATPVATATPAVTATPAPAAVGCTYYISTTGRDSNSGKTLQTAWATFRRAWDSLYPGDTLCIGDGTYIEPIQPNIRNGETGKPITIKAINDGRVTIDGQGKNIPVRLGENWGPNGPIGNWFVVEGIVARNGTLSDFRIEHGNNNVLRRISAYNADRDDNAHAIAVIWSDNNLVEDCVAAGTGRYMINVFTSNNNTIRRCFAMWQQWDGRHFCGVSWPNGNNVGVYNSNNTTVENVVAYGRSLTGIFIQANDNAVSAINNQVLGSLSVLNGRDYNGSYWTYGTGEVQPTSRPGPITNPYGDPCPDNITQWSWGGQRVGFSLYGQGSVRDNLFKDVVAVDNEGIGLAIQRVYLSGSPGWSNNRFEACSARGNGRSLAGYEQSLTNSLAPNAYNNSQGGATFAANCNIQGTQYQGPGAQIVRYVDRVRTGDNVLPWPMQSRIMSEIGVDVESIWRKFGGAR